MLYSFCVLLYLCFTRVISCCTRVVLVLCHVVLVLSHVVLLLSHVVSCGTLLCRVALVTYSRCVALSRVVTRAVVSKARSHFRVAIEL